MLIQQIFTPLQGRRLVCVAGLMHIPITREKGNPTLPVYCVFACGEDITVSLNMITGFAQPLGTLGTGQLSSQSSYYCPSESPQLRGQNPTWWCRDSYWWAQGERGLLYPWQGIPLSSVPTKDRSGCTHLQDVQDCCPCADPRRAWSSPRTFQKWLTLCAPLRQTCKEVDSFSSVALMEVR